MWKPTLNLQFNANPVSVAKFSIRLALPAGIPDWTTFLSKDARPLPPAADFDRMVERDSNGPAPGILPGR